MSSPGQSAQASFEKTYGWKTALRTKSGIRRIDGIWSPSPNLLFPVLKSQPLNGSAIKQKPEVLVLAHSGTTCAVQEALVVANATGPLAICTSMEPKLALGASPCLASLIPAHFGADRFEISTRKTKERSKYFILSIEFKRPYRAT